MTMDGSDYSVAVFPFLKTSRAVALGKFMFRPTTDTSNLPSNQAASVREIADMLFLQDDLRLESASYTVIPTADIRGVDANMQRLQDVQAVVAYGYAAPRDDFPGLFLPPENSSLVVLFSPRWIPPTLVRPDHHVKAVQSQTDLLTDDRHLVQAYEGLYNFRHTFWVAKGSRIYPPVPHLGLNISQDLSNEFDRVKPERLDYQLLGELLWKSETAMSVRIFIALRWFNTANSRANDESAAVVDLAIAFEALLGLPSTEKTDRIIDAISLLLGRTARLDVWARQFYDARSCVVHEGSASELRFRALDSQSKSQGLPYQSLLDYGRRVFQLCLGTLLAGAALASDARLEETLITNEERFHRMCKTLDDPETLPAKRLDLIVPLVKAADRYRYLSEPGLQLKTMLATVRLAAKTALVCDGAIPDEIRTLLQQLSAKMSADFLPELEVVEMLENKLAGVPTGNLSSEASVLRDLVQLVWHYTCMHYLWAKRDKGSKMGE